MKKLGFLALKEQNVIGKRKCSTTNFSIQLSTWNRKAIQLRAVKAFFFHFKKWLVKQYYEILKPESDFHVFKKFFEEKSNLHESSVFPQDFKFQKLKDKKFRVSPTLKFFFISTTEYSAEKIHLDSLIRESEVLLFLNKRTGNSWTIYAYRII